MREVKILVIVVLYDDIEFEIEFIFILYLRGINEEDEIEIIGNK